MPLPQMPPPLTATHTLPLQQPTLSATPQPSNQPCSCLHDSHVPSVWQSSLGLVLRDLFLKQSVTASWLGCRGGGWWWGGNGQLVAAAAHTMSPTVTPVEANIHALETLHLPLPLMLHPPPTPPTPHPTHTHNDQVLRDLILDQMEANPGAKLYVCGHSLGEFWVQWPVLVAAKSGPHHVHCDCRLHNKTYQLQRAMCVCVAGGALAVVFMGALMHDASKRVSNRCPLAIGALQSGSVSPGRR